MYLYQRDDNVSKTTEMIRVTGILILSCILLGIIGYLGIAVKDTFVRTPQNIPVDLTQNAGSFSEYTSLKSQYEQRLTQNIEETLGKIIGSNAVKATVHAEMDLTQSQNQKNFLLPTQMVIKSNNIVEKGRDAKGNDLYEQTIQYDYSSQNETQNNTFERVKKLSMTVLIDGYELDGTYQPRSLNEMQTFRSLVESVSGFNRTRGDTLEMINIPFTEKTPAWVVWLQNPTTLNILFMGLFILISLWILWGFVRPLTKQLKTPDIPHLTNGQKQTVFETKPKESFHLLRHWIHNLEEEGVKKAAVLLLSLGEEKIKDIFTHLSDEEIISLSRQMGKLGHIDTETIRTITNEFVKGLTQNPDIISTAEQTRQVLQNTLPSQKAQTILDALSIPVTGKSIWDKLAKVDTSILMPYLLKETPAVLTVILYQLPSEKAGQILIRLPDALRQDLLVRLSQLGDIDTDTLSLIEQGLEKQLPHFFARQQTYSGKEKLAHILSLLPKENEESLLNKLYERAPDAAEDVSAGLLSFDQLAEWSNADIKTLLTACDKSDVIYALKGAGDNIKDAFSRNIAPKIWADLMREVAAVGAVRMNQIDAAQVHILKTAHALIQQGKVKESL